MSNTYFAITFHTHGKPYVYRSAEGFEAAFALASAVSKKLRGKIAVSIRPLNRASGTHRVSELRD